MNLTLCKFVAREKQSRGHGGSVLKRDRDWKFRLRSGSGSRVFKHFRGKKLLCEVLKINFENHEYSKKKFLANLNVA